MPAISVRNTLRLLSLLAAALILAMLALPAAVQAAATTSSTATGQTAVSSATTSVPSDQGVPTGPAAVVPPAAGWVPLNGSWRTDQMDVRVMPEYDEPGVLVIIGFTLPADVALPATLKFPMPAGAWIGGIGEVDPTGSFVYNYAGSYPAVEPGAVWDIATIEVKDYRQIQIDYYYNPGLPEGAGQRSFPLLAQMPMDATSLLLHVQQPARATDFSVQPALQGSGQGDDGFTYSVSAYQDVKAGSTLGHVVSYYSPDGGLSTDSGESSPAQVNTNTVLLGAILFVVLCIGAIVVYRLSTSSRRAGQKNGRPKAQGSPAAKRSPADTRQQRPTAETSAKGSGSTKTSTKGSAKTSAGTAKVATPKAAAAADAAKTTELAAKRDGDAVEYCVACGEELTTKSRFCPDCGEARP
jgi:hypothetical protein